MVKLADEQTDLRRGLDHIGISVCFVIHDGQGRILLQKRGPKARDERGNWDVGGGAIEFGETLDEAIRRELKEELSTTALEIKFLTAYDALREHQGQKTHWIALLHGVRVDPSKVRIGEPHKVEEIGWFTSDTLPTPLHSQFHKAYDIVLKEGLIK